jgi:hypothetical protein
MSRTGLYVLVVVLIVGIGVGGFAYYQHQQNTLVELDVGSHSVSVQKN